VLWNTPNLLTLLRIFLIPVFIAAYYLPFHWAPLLTTVLFTEETPDKTRVTVTSEPNGEVTSAEVEAFIRERAGMTLGWTNSFDALEALVQ